MYPKTKTVRDWIDAIRSSTSSATRYWPRWCVSAKANAAMAAAKINYYYRRHISLCVRCCCAFFLFLFLQYVALCRPLQLRRRRCRHRPFACNTQTFRTHTDTNTPGVVAASSTGSHSVPSQSQSEFSESWENCVTHKFLDTYSIDVRRSVRWSVGLLCCVVLHFLFYCYYFSSLVYLFSLWNRNPLSGLS